MLSTGRSGSSIQTAEAYITAQLNSLSKYNANLVLGQGSTFNGDLNKGGIPNIIVASTAPTASDAGITLNGTTFTYIPVSYLPIIKPQTFEQYATIVLNNNGTITIPPSALSFYSLTGVSAYTCTIGSNFSSLLSSDFSFTSGTTLGTWNINITEPINAFIYTPANVDFPTSTSASSSLQLTIVAGGSINVANSVNLYPFAYYSATGSTTAATNSTITPPVNVCSGDSSLPVCNGATPYTNLQGLVLLSTGNITTSGNNSTFNGDIATSGSLTLNGGGSYTFGGTIVAENGIGATTGKSSKTSTTVNGAITLTSPVAAANSATLGGYQLTASSIRWVP